MENQKDPNNAIPPQRIGTRMDAVEEQKTRSAEEALALFHKASDRLLAVNQWGELAGLSDFQLIDAQGIRAERKAQNGDFIRIDIPGPGSNAGAGYDWVRIIQILEHEDPLSRSLTMMVRPSAHPLSAKAEIAHFLKVDATSTFVIRMEGLSVFAEEHGRNELPNINEGSFYDKGRNFMVGMVAKLGLAYPQWKNLVKALLKD